MVKDIIKNLKTCVFWKARVKLLEKPKYYYKVFIFIQGSVKSTVAGSDQFFLVGKSTDTKIFSVYSSRLVSASTILWIYQAKNQAKIVIFACYCENFNSRGENLD